MEFTQQQPSSKAPADWFTGDVWWDVVHAGQEPSRMRVNMVRFSPGARTHWHSHALGQALHVVSGIALIGTRDGTVFEATRERRSPAREELWHGAAPRPVHGAPRHVGGQGRRYDRDHLPPPHPQPVSEARSGSRKSPAPEGRGPGQGSGVCRGEHVRGRVVVTTAAAPANPLFERLAPASPFRPDSPRLA